MASAYCVDNLVSALFVGGATAATRISHIAPEEALALTAPSRFGPLSFCSVLPAGVARGRAGVMRRRRTSELQQQSSAIQHLKY